jgi:hypothetical protein
MEVAGHLDTERSKGGKGKTNRYRPRLRTAKHLENNECSGRDKHSEKSTGLEGENPAENASQTLRKPELKHSEKGERNPIEEPFDESPASEGGPSARPSSADASYTSSTLKGDNEIEQRAPDGAPPILTNRDWDDGEPEWLETYLPRVGQAPIGRDKDGRPFNEYQAMKEGWT